MRSLTLLYITALCCTCRSHATADLYPDTPLPPQQELIQKLVAEVEDGENNNDLTEQRDSKNVLSVLLQRGRERDSWAKSAKESEQQEKISNMVDDLKAVVMKMAAADNLRSTGFLRSEQSLPKNKRACFWKYCVTN